MAAHLPKGDAEVRVPPGFCDGGAAKTPRVDVRRLLLGEIYNPVVRRTEIKISGYAGNTSVAAKSIVEVPSFAHSDVATAARAQKERQLIEQLRIGQRRKIGPMVSQHECGLDCHRHLARLLLQPIHALAERLG